MNEAYKKQVRLLLHVLPEVAKERCFAMHGGTAINLFVRDMPRLSVDVDLTYVEIAGRTETIEAVNAALDRVHKRIKKLSESLSVKHNQNICKLNISGEGCLVKIDVNMVNRGLLGDVYNAVLCPTAQASFDSFCVVPIAPLSQLYGGKICASLDRQHPRDLFDVKMM